MQHGMSKHNDNSRIKRIRGSLLVFLLGGPGFWLYRFLMYHDHFLNNWMEVVFLSSIISLLGAILSYIVTREAKE